MGYHDQMRATAEVHGAYLADLIANGFERGEAMQLVRDHHACMVWFSLVREDSPPPWLTAPTSSEPSGTTGRVLQLSKLPTTEQ